MRSARLVVSGIAVALAAAAAPADGRPPGAEPSLLSPGQQVALAQSRLVAPVDGSCTPLRATPSSRAALRHQLARTGRRRIVAWFCGGPVRTVRDGWVQATAEPRRAGGRSTTGWAPIPVQALWVLPYTVVVHRDRHEAVVLHGRRVVRRITVGVGGSATPTTLGVTHVTARIRLPRGHRGYAVYGPHILALGLPAADGPGQLPAFRGEGMLAFHAGAGGASSHGCMHASPADLAWMIRHLPAGTRVRIVR